MSENMNEVDKLKHMVSVLSKDLQTAQAEQKRAMENSAQIEQKKKDEEEKLRKQLEEMKRQVQDFNKVSEALENVRKQKKEQYKEIVNENVKPFLEKLRAESNNNTKLASAIDYIETDVNAAVEKGCIDPKDDNTVTFITAVASADKVRSSDLQRLLQTEEQWGKQMEELKQQKEELEKQAAEKDKEYQEAKELQDKLVEQLRAELREIQTTAEKTKENINNQEAHFTEKEAVVESTPMESDAVPASSEEAKVVQATASGSKTSSGINQLMDFQPLFTFKPDPNWRTRTNSYQ